MEEEEAFDWQACAEREGTEGLEDWFEGFSGGPAIASTANYLHLADDEQMQTAIALSLSEVTAAHEEASRGDMCSDETPASNDDESDASDTWTEVCSEETPAFDDDQSDASDTWTEV